MVMVLVVLPPPPLQSEILIIACLLQNTHDSQDRKPLDHENFELLQRIIADSGKQDTETVTTENISNTPLDKQNVFSEEQALQRAIYESTHDAVTSPRATSATKPIAPEAAAAATTTIAAATTPPGGSNWLRMDSLVSTTGTLTCIDKCFIKMHFTALQGLNARPIAMSTSIAGRSFTTQMPRNGSC